MPGVPYKNCFGWIGLCVLAGASQAAEWDVQWEGNIQLQNRVYFHEPAPQQHAGPDYSYALTPQLKAGDPAGDVLLTGKLFYRKDFTDRARTHWDIRELKLDQNLGDTQITWGVDSVFWGKTESQNLVDIINQRDGVEGVFSDEKLGQPMVRLRQVSTRGVLEAYYLPYSRQATYAGRDGRLRTMPGIEGDRAQYRSGAGQWYPGFAMRWEPDMADVDLGLSVFHGLSRDPSFAPIRHDAEAWFAPVYSPVTQLGLDSQYVTEQTLYKLEAIYRTGQLDLALRERNYAAVTIGLEHTLGSFMGGSGDLGLILEYNRDGMGKRSINPLQDDIVLGARYTLNDSADTYLLATVALDRIYASQLYKIELTRRLGQSLKLTAEAFIPSLNDDQEFIYGYRRDAVVTTSLSYYW
ncbi:hypothetical protein ACN079_15970 [Pseudomonas sp. ABY48]|uniref:hypothetical protein n=1 Tax=Pseudomonas sp. ABY48 TaxID=3402865 RepID=UPI003B42A1D7